MALAQRVPLGHGLTAPSVLFCSNLFCSCGYFPCNRARILTLGLAQTTCSTQMVGMCLLLCACVTANVPLPAVLTHYLLNYLPGASTCSCVRALHYRVYLTALSCNPSNRVAGFFVGA